jgi:hypothetical protein
MTTPMTTDNIKQLFLTDRDIFPYIYSKRQSFDTVMGESMLLHILTILNDPNVSYDETYDTFIKKYNCPLEYFNGFIKHIIKDYNHYYCVDEYRYNGYWCDEEWIQQDGVCPIATFREGKDWC